MSIFVKQKIPFKVFLNKLSKLCSSEEKTSLTSFLFIIMFSLLYPINNNTIINKKYLDILDIYLLNFFNLLTLTITPVKTINVTKPIITMFISLVLGFFTSFCVPLVVWPVSSVAFVF